MAALRIPGTSSSRPRRRALLVAAVLVATLAPVSASAAEDPRVGLAPGYFPWTDTSSNIELLDNDPRVAPFDAAPGNFGFVNSDLAFTGKHAIVGSFNGFQVYDVSNPADPVLSGSFVCPGGQGDVSVFGNLLFMSVEETRGRIDCGTQGPTGTVNACPLPRRAHLRHQRPQQPGAAARRADLPRLAHAHARDGPGRPGERLHLQLRDRRAFGPSCGAGGCVNASKNSPPVTTGDPALWRSTSSRCRWRHRRPPPS